MESPSPPTCPQLLELARGGDEEAFGTLFEAATPRLLLYVRLRLSPGLAGKLEVLDVVQEAGLEAFRSITGFEARGPGSFSRWLCRIAENRMRDLAAFHRAKKRDPGGIPEGITRVLDRVRHSATGPLSAADRKEREERVGQALERLEEDEREALLRRFFEGATIEEIARALGRSETAVRRLLGRAVLRVGHLLEGEGA